MAGVRVNHALKLIVALALGWPSPTLAQHPPASPPPSLYNRPVLVVDPGMHTAPIIRADVDAEGRYVVTGSKDKTVRIWSVEDGQPLTTIRMPAGPDAVGEIRAVAISPDGKLIAAGGLTRWTEADQQEQIYLFDRATGGMGERIEGLPTPVTHLTFSPDGRYLAVMLTKEGLRVFNRDAGWAEVARDTDYDDSSYGADFSADGRLATTSRDGRVRLYDRDFQLAAAIQTTGGQRPVGVAFSPDGTKLAVGYADTTVAVVDLLDGRSLTPLPGPDTTGIDSDLSKVAWSADGEKLFAGGGYGRYEESEPGARRHQVVEWAGAGLGARRELPAGTSTIMSLAPLANGRLLVAAQDPYLALLDPDEGARWAQESPTADFRDQHDVFAVSFDGQIVDFGYEQWGQTPARFNVSKLLLDLDPPEDGRTAPAKWDRLPIDGWQHTEHPTLNGKPLLPGPFERSRSLAIDPDGERFVLGTEWYLRAYAADGERLGRIVAPGIVWAVNITGDGRLVVAAYGDGTIRWHRMEDGQELLAFLPLAGQEKNWVAWTPEGFYAARRGPHEVLRWHVNHGWDAPGEAVPVSNIAELRRPEVLPLVLQEMEIVEALGIAELEEARRAVQVQTNSAVKPGTQLHVLAIGVGDYNEESLRLEFADKDAWDVASALDDTQGSLYAKVNPLVLRNGEATEAGLYEAFATMHARMQPGDVAVVHFSGHGALFGGALYLLLHEVDARTEARVKAGSIEIGQLRKEVLSLAERGRVLVLLDACRSGATTEDGADTRIDATQLRTALVAANVTVLTSSSGQENSIEHAKWRNGAFTQAFLEALGPGADSDRNSVVSMTELFRYVADGVPRLVREVDPERQQTPGIEMRFEGTIFAAGL